MEPQGSCSAYAPEVVRIYVNHLQRLDVLQVARKLLAVMEITPPISSTDWQCETRQSVTQHPNGGAKDGRFEVIVIIDDAYSEVGGLVSEHVRQHRGHRGMESGTTGSLA